MEAACGASKLCVVEQARGMFRNVSSCISLFANDQSQVLIFHLNVHAVMLPVFAFAECEINTTVLRQSERASTRGRLRPAPGILFVLSMSSLLPLPVSSWRGRASRTRAKRLGRVTDWGGYSFFSAGTAGGAGGVGTAGVSVGGAGVDPGAGNVCATGASCQWPCSADHTFPGGTSPGG